MDAIALNERRGDPTRCPFCLDAVQAADERRCDACGAPHHAACLTERGACAACKLAPPPRQQEVSVEPVPGRLLVVQGPDGLSIQLPAPSFAALGPPLGLAIVALYAVGLIAALILIVGGGVPWYWALFTVSMLVVSDAFSVGLALIARAVGRERLIIDTKRVRLERRALGRFGEDVEVPLADVQSLLVWPTGRGSIETARARHSFGRGLTQDEVRWIGRTLNARLPR